VFVPKTIVNAGPKPSTRTASEMCIKRYIFWTDTRVVVLGDTTWQQRLQLNTGTATVSGLILWRSCKRSITVQRCTVSLSGVGR